MTHVPVIGRHEGHTVYRICIVGNSNKVTPHLAPGDAAVYVGSDVAYQQLVEVVIYIFARPNESLVRNCWRVTVFHEQKSLFSVGIAKFVTNVPTFAFP